MVAKGSPVEAKTETVYDVAGNAVEIRSPRYFNADDLNGIEKCRAGMTCDGVNRALTHTNARGTLDAGADNCTY